jgi:hypothetical protein
MFSTTNIYLFYLRDDALQFPSYLNTLLGTALVAEAPQCLRVTAPRSDSSSRAPVDDTGTAEVDDAVAGLRGGLDCVGS